MPGMGWVGTSATVAAAKPKGREREEAAGEKAFVEMLGEEHNTRVATAARVNFMVNRIELYDASHTQVERVSDDMSEKSAKPSRKGALTHQCRSDT